MKIRTINHNALVSLIAAVLMAVILTCTISCDGPDNPAPVTPSTPVDAPVPTPMPAPVEPEQNVAYCSQKSEPSEDPDICLMHEQDIREAYAEEIRYMAQTAWGEARGCSTVEQAGVYWCILNRVDSDSPDFPNTIIEVITQEDQFHGYDPDYPVTPELADLAVDVLTRWIAEQLGAEDVGRVLPKEYLWFHGDGKHNHFRNQYRGDYTYWDWSLPSPYPEGV